MDKFLKPNAEYYRLWSIYHKHGKLVVACDFDDTLYDVHNTGESFEMVRQLVRDLHQIGCHIAIWTGNKDFAFVTSFLDSVNVPFHSINEDASFIDEKHISRKLYYNVLIDDKAGLACVYNSLTRLVNEIKNKKPLSN